ncbi:hypothetical protein [Virgibacillus siamensis]|uniref:hypothetical protein n=1 Tax=Virgibacillus siamensis TaxID=480071 RepID=UPI0009852C09|nr:hypothetical protein [Virgibacillus siamensis]
MELQKISEMILKTSTRIDNATVTIYKLAKERSETEYEYRKALGQEIARLKAEGTPVSIIGDIARGNTAELKLKRDMADSMYTSARDSMKALQSELSGLQSIYKVQSEV